MLLINIRFPLLACKRSCDKVIIRIKDFQKMTYFNSWSSFIFFIALFVVKSTFEIWLILILESFLCKYAFRLFEYILNSLYYWVRAVLSFQKILSQLKKCLCNLDITLTRFLMVWQYWWYLDYSIHNSLEQLFKYSCLKFLKYNTV